MFLFGLTAEQVANSRGWYDPHWHYEHEDETRQALDLVFSGHFNRRESGIYNPIRDALLTQGDYYMHLADLASYTATQSHVSDLYGDRRGWGRKAIRNVAQSGKFSSDRTIAECTRDDLGSDSLSHWRVRSRLSAIAPIIVTDDTRTSKWRVIYEEDFLGPRPLRARGSGFGRCLAVVEARSGRHMPAGIVWGMAGSSRSRSTWPRNTAGESRRFLSRGGLGRGGTGPRQDEHRTSRRRSSRKTKRNSPKAKKPPPP